MTEIDYDCLWKTVIESSGRDFRHSVHGPDHWLRVERNGCILASLTGANIQVVRLFALFHDCRRINDHHDPQHGSRGAALAKNLRGEWFNLSDNDFELLHFACSWHTHGNQHEDPTVGTCWDADRLDLGRVGIIPSAKFMSTAFGAEIADYGSTYPWIELAKDQLESPLSHHLKWQS